MKLPRHAAVRLSLACGERQNCTIKEKEMHPYYSGNNMLCDTLLTDPPICSYVTLETLNLYQPI